MAMDAHVLKLPRKKICLSCPCIDMLPKGIPASISNCTANTRDYFNNIHFGPGLITYEDLIVRFSEIGCWEVIANGAFHCLSMSTMNKYTLDAETGLSEKLVKLTLSRIAPSRINKSQLFVIAYLNGLFSLTAQIELQPPYFAKYLSWHLKDALKAILNGGSWLTEDIVLSGIYPSKWQSELENSTKNWATKFSYGTVEKQEQILCHQIRESQVMDILHGLPPLAKEKTRSIRTGLYELIVPNLVYGLIKSNHQLFGAEHLLHYITNPGSVIPPVFPQSEFDKMEKSYTKQGGIIF